MTEKKHPSQWAHPIDVRDFTDIVAEPIAIEPGKRHLFETKDSLEPTGYRLRAKVRMTFAGLRTRNKALYLPDEHYKSAGSFIKPYPKPIQLHHNDERDPIGRVIDVRYVDTSNEAISLDSRVATAMKTFRDSKSKPLARMGTVPTFLSMSKNAQYRGVGHLLGLWDVTDPDAIRKILDGRYLTVSTAMAPAGACCSICALKGEFVDWAVEQCEHERGDFVDGVECVAIPYNYDWEEVSPVNHPAAKLAQIIEVGTDLSFSDAVNKNIIDSSPLFEDVHVVHDQKAFRIKDWTEITNKDLFDWTENSNSINNSNTPLNLSTNVIGKKNDGLDHDNKGQNMKLTDLTKDTSSNYDAIAKHLSGARMTGDLLGALEDSVFVGPSRTFPVTDLDHASAIKALLAEIEDSESKSTLLEAIEDRVVALTPAPAEEPAAEVIVDSAPAVVVETDSVSLSKAEFDELKALADQTEDLRLDRDLLKRKVESLKAEVKALSDAQSETLKSYKGMLAEALVDAQTSRGFKIEDRVAKLKELSGRSIEALTTSLHDFRSQPQTGTNKPASGEQVENPLTSSATEQDKNQIKGIIKTYWDKYYSPEGPAGATRYWNQMRAENLVPANVTP